MSNATKAGYHSIKDFDCYRRGYFRQICKLEPVVQPAHFAFGTAVHAWKAKFYETWEPPKSFDLPRDAYEFEDKWLEDLERGKRVLAKWHSTWADYDREHLKVLAVEQEYQYDLGDGLVLTIRPDLVAEHDHLGVLAQDSKTSSIRPSTLYPQLESGNQSTAYSLVLREIYDGFAGWMPDIMYSKGSVIECERPGIIYRTEQQLLDFKVEVKSTIVDIGDRVAEIGSAPIRALFPANDSFCWEYFRPCPFLEICRDNITPDQEPPEGYRRTIDG